MKFFSICILFFVLGCSVNQNESKNIDGEENETPSTPFPRQYADFYAGMSAKEFYSNAYEKNFYITYDRSEWARMYDGEIFGPQYQAESGGITLVGYITNDTIARLEFNGKGDFVFDKDVEDIFESFGEGIGNTSQKTMFRGDLKTHIDKGADKLIFTHVELWKQRMDEEKAFREEIKKEIQEKYQ